MSKESKNDKDSAVLEIQELINHHLKNTESILNNNIYKLELKGLDITIRIKKKLKKKKEIVRELHIINTKIS